MVFTRSSAKRKASDLSAAEPTSSLAEQLDRGLVKSTSPLPENEPQSSKKHKIDHVKDDVALMIDTPPTTPESLPVTCTPPPTTTMAKLWSMAAAQKKNTPTPPPRQITPPSSSGRQTMLPPDPAYRGIQMNGLLDESQIPDSVKDIVERNAKEAPLLRLPHEVRQEIWEYVFDGQDVEISRRHKGQKTGMTGWAVEREPVGLGVTSKHISSAFRLPEVCRQIYSEIAVFGYSRSTFVIDECGPNFGLRLTPAARDMIASVELSTADAISLRDNIPWYHFLLDRSKLFPGLKRLGIPLCALREDSLKKRFTPDLYDNDFANTARLSEMSNLAKESRLDEQRAIREWWAALGQEWGLEIFYTYYEGGDLVPEPDPDDQEDEEEEDDDEDEDGDDDEDEETFVVPTAPQVFAGDD